MDVFPRYGGFVGFYPLYDPRLMWSNVIGPNGARELLWIERREGYVDQFLQSYPMGSTDCLVVFSHGGLNAAPIEAALYAKQRGTRVISVSSHQNATVAARAHSSRKALSEVADVAIDNCVPPEDALVDIGRPERVAAGSTMAAVFVAMALVAETGARLAAAGHAFTTFVSPNVPGVARDHNLRVFDEYARRLVRARTRPGRALMDRHPRQRLTVLDALAFAGMLVFGIVMALLGAVMPIVSERLAFGLGDIGTLFLAMNAAMLAASLVVAPAADRFGTKGPVALGALLVAFALVAIARASRFGDLLPAVACLGFGGGALNATTNILVADLHDDPESKASALNLLGMFFGFGALLLPFGIGALLSTVGLAGLLSAAALLCLVIALVATLARFPAPKQAHGRPLAGMRRFLRLPLVLAMAFLLFFQSGNEFMLGAYFTTFLTRELGVAVAPASYLLAGYWAAMMTARLLLSRFVLRFGAQAVVFRGAVLAAGGALAVASATGAPAAVGGILITGAALAGIFPTVLGIAGAAFPGHSGTVFGILFTVALTGGTVLPPLAARLGASAGLRAVFVLVAVDFVVVALLSGLVRRFGTRHA